MIIKTLRGYFVLRYYRTSDEVTEESRNIEKIASEMLNNCPDTLKRKKLLRAILGARCNLADHLRNQNKCEEALHIFSSSIDEVEQLEDELFKDMWLKHITFTLMKLKREEQIVEAIQMLQKQIEWANNAGEWRRLAAAFHHLGEAKTLLSDHASGVDRHQILLDAEAAFKKAVEWDICMLRPRYIGWDYRELATVYYRLAREGLDGINVEDYLTLARNSVLEALPRLEQFNNITDDVVALAKDLDVKYPIRTD